MLDCIGENWREITGLGAEQVDSKTAPGYNHETYWPRVLQFEKNEGPFYLSQLTEGDSSQSTETPDEPELIHAVENIMIAAEDETQSL